MTEIESAEKNEGFDEPTANEVNTIGKNAFSDAQQSVINDALGGNVNQNARQTTQTPLNAINVKPAAGKNITTPNQAQENATQQQGAAAKQTTEKGITP